MKSHASTFAGSIKKNVNEKRSSRASNVSTFAVQIRSNVLQEEPRLAARIQSGNGFATLGAATELATNSTLNFNPNTTVTENKWRAEGIHSPDALASVNTIHYH